MNSQSPVFKLKPPKVFMIDDDALKHHLSQVQEYVNEMTPSPREQSPVDRIIPHAKELLLNDKIQLP
jgi:hypothetical protein